MIVSPTTNAVQVSPAGHCPIAHPPPAGVSHVLPVTTQVQNAVPPPPVLAVWNA